ncbi:LacI family transcriptional regulator [Opitutaceae bacterium TAV3]|nr:LacI family transcriptional regulator [Opitutaceae bacterium TAV3]
MRSPSKPIVTQAQIARKAGISQAAVSAILSGVNGGTLNVSDETRQRVLTIAEKLGYVSRKAAPRANASTRNVLIVCAQAPRRATNEEWIENTYQTLMGKILTTASQQLNEQNFALSVFHLGESTRLTQWLADSDIRGVLWRAADTDTALLHWIASRIPLVLLNRERHSATPMDVVSIDQEMNIRMAAEHLWTLGHRRIATFGHYSGNSFFRARINAYRQFTEERGIRNYTEFQSISDEPERPALDKVDEIIATWKHLDADAPTALITSDVFALPLLHRAASAGITIPRQLSIVGIDNTSACPLMTPALTSLDQPFEEMTRVAVDLLLRRMSSPGEPDADNSSQNVRIAPRLIIRQSVQDLSTQPPATASKATARSRATAST